MEGLCAACGHATKDLYPVSPATGRVDPARRWCRDCYEGLAARATREKYTANERKERENAEG